MICIKYTYLLIYTYSNGSLYIHGIDYSALSNKVNVVYNKQYKGLAEELRLILSIFPNLNPDPFSEIFLVFPQTVLSNILPLTQFDSVNQKSEKKTSKISKKHDDKKQYLHKFLNEV